MQKKLFPLSVASQHGPTGPASFLEGGVLWILKEEVEGAQDHMSSG